jgi:hypothetical protein
MTVDETLVQERVEDLTIVGWTITKEEFGYQKEFVMGESELST